MDRFETVQDLFHRFRDVSSRGNFLVAKAIFREAQTHPENEKRILYIYLLYLLLNSCESVIRLTRVLRNFQTEDPWENFLKNDTEEFTQERIQCIYNEVVRYQNRPIDFFTYYLELDLHNPEKKQFAINGIYQSILASLRNLMVPQNKQMYNKIKHGFAVLDKQSISGVVFYLSSSENQNGKVPVAMQVNDENAKLWLGTIEALANTQQNLSHLLHSVRRE